MFRAGIHTQMGGPYFRAGTNTGDGWALLLHSKVLWLVRWFVDSLIVPMVFHMPINGLGAHLKRVRSGDRVTTCDCIDDQSLGRSCDTFPGSRVCISHDPKVVKMSRDWTCDWSGDSFPGSHGQRVDSTTWLYLSLGAALGGLGLGILWMHDVMDSVLNRNPPAPPPAAPMAQPNPPPHILGTAPKPYNGKGDMAIAFWNALKNYFTVNATTFDTNTKKVSSALTYFKQGTQAGDWASDHIANILSGNPINYGTWDDFRDAFKAQFIPPEMQNEAIQNIHNTPQRNQEFGEWYQEWSRYARQANMDEATKMYAFRRALDTALHNKLLQLSPMLTMLARLVEKAREFDKNWRTFAGPTRGFQQWNPHIREILEEESEINAFPWPSPFGQNQGRGHRCGCGCGHGCGRLTLEERKCCINNNLCLYCAIPRHIAINCTALPNSRPGSSFWPQSSRPSIWQINSIPEEGMEKLPLEDESELNIASVNQFEPLVKLNLDENTSFLGTL